MSPPTPRRGELLNLRWKDIDLDGKKITITGSTAVIAGARVNGTTKSGRTRVVSIDDETVGVLRQRKADQAAEQLKAGDSWRGTKDGHVFTTGWGEPIYPDTVTSLMTKLVRANTQLGTQLLANPLARKPLPRSERGSDLGAAYRNRTDDLRITRGPLRCTHAVTCTDSTPNRT